MKQQINHAQFVQLKYSHQRIMQFYGNLCSICFIHLFFYANRICYLRNLFRLICLISLAIFYRLVFCSLDSSDCQLLCCYFYREAIETNQSLSLDFYYLYCVIIF